MDETETKTEDKEEQPTKDTGTGDKPATTPLIDIANQAAERMEIANKETARLQEVQAERDQRIALGGRAEAGQEPVEKKEESPKEYNDRINKEMSEGQHND